MLMAQAALSILMAAPRLGMAKAAAVGMMVRVIPVLGTLMAVGVTLILLEVLAVGVPMALV
jgi:hypothetical protein